MDATKSEGLNEGAVGENQLKDLQSRPFTTEIPQGWVDKFDYEWARKILESAPASFPICSEPATRPSAGQAFLMDCKPRDQKLLNSCAEMRSQLFENHMNALLIIV
ncbi:MAG: hypothetical protein GY820_42680 [Gammaproteobacteria bacterium]|nr:hypothetical protein [Gammaproteobacteria bacterium]